MLAGDIANQIAAELAQAEAARAAGFEGRARVNARRAAGIAIRAYFQARGVSQGQASAFELIQLLREQTDLPEGVSQVLDHLLQRVNPDFALPEAVDLIAETRWLVKTLKVSGNL